MAPNNKDIPNVNQEEAFHDNWAETIDPREVLVDESFESCTTPEAAQIMAWLGDLSGKKLLDLGSGAGESAVYFAKKGAAVTATDLSGEMLRVVADVAQLHRVIVTTQKCRADALPFPDGTFDIVHAANLLHHVNIAATLKEAHRVLKDGGVAVFWDPIAHNPLINIYRRIATDVRTADEHPIRFSELQLYREQFSEVKYECFWFLTLLLFVKFYLIDRVHPNKERFWKKIIREADSLKTTYGALERMDKVVLKALPFCRRFCWNIVIHCRR
jgi:ubiquinone/menaquinone biosynthesis C-methylase UbiE